MQDEVPVQRTRLVEFLQLREEPGARTRGAILSVDSVRQDAAVLGEATTASLRLGDNIGVSQPFRGELDEVGLTRKTAHPEAFGGK